MLVFIDTTYGSTFFIELNLNNKVIDIKNKIENSQGIPVSMQTLYYNGEPLLFDHLDLNTCNIVTNSRLFLALPNQEDNNQVLLAPSTSVQDSLGQFQDWSTTARSNYRQNIQETSSRRHDRNQDLIQSEASSTSYTFGEDLPLPTELFSNIQSHSTEGNVSFQESLGRHHKNQDSTSNTFGDLMFGEDPPLSTDIQSYLPASTTEESIDVFHKEQSNTFGDLLFGEDPLLSTEQISNIRSHWPASTTEENIDTSNLSHTQQSTIQSNTCGDLLFGEDLATEFFSNIGVHRPASTTEESIDTSNLLHTQQSTMQSNTLGDNLLFGEDPPPLLSTEDIFINKEQVFQTEQPLVPPNTAEQRSNLVVQTEKSPLMKEVINVPDSPVKVRRFRRPPQRLRVMVLPHSPDNEPVSKVAVSMMANENVEELRKELEKLRDRNELKIPEKGYFFIHKQNVLDDDQSFLWNGVAHGDTIEVFPGYVTKEGRTFGL